MNLSPSIDLIWRLAASEMVAAQFKEIEPEHFCMALLKFAELPMAAIEKDHEYPEIVHSIAADADLLREALQKCGIESTLARRKLRGQFGKGGVPHRVGDVHRSPASRALFEAAAALVSEAEDDRLTPIHLLTALVQSPRPAIAQAVLGKPPAAPPPAVLLLDNYGVDLVMEAAEGRIKADSTAEASSKAVLKILLQNERKSIVLITDDDDVARTVAIAVACAIAGKESPAALRGHRLIDISASNHLEPTSGITPPLEDGAQILDRLRQLLAEAASHPEIILVVPTVEGESKAAAEWSRLLRDAFVKGEAQCICRVSPKTFAEHLRKDAVWKRQTAAVWLQKAAAGSIPREL